ncbi:Cof-type HAD-IIB family hydrolase [Amycolatopsis alkalitolerans]|uniref:HAD family phosphatase n=1 Tax=Amycolatopsis alkalitolerans TaxID=2547244 RepID=A0A5C4M573_9PSEU|nr:HAD family hydrolase [Amycolatopsis alkalitolerans]TNC27432.1 HAD family phosphatase [Amycolatopsis alkalitolerans]
MEQPLLIASDVDGTLLDTYERLSSRTLAVVRRVADAGVPLVLASGRPPRWIPSVAEPAGLTGYAVCANGAVLYDIGEDLVAEVNGLLEPMLLREVVAEVARALPRCGFAAERIGKHALDSDIGNLVIEDSFRNPWGDGEGMRVTRGEIVGHPAMKLLVSRPGMTSDEMAEAVGAVLDESVDITFSAGSGLIEISARGITKATGLAEVAARLGVPAERIIAFGDMPNDVAMLRWAGHGVAMANAHPAVREAADEITGPNTEDGVAQVLERWF